VRRAAKAAGQLFLSFLFLALVLAGRLAEGDCSAAEVPRLYLCFFFFSRLFSLFLSSA
jgi:hypothetical protein